MILMSRKANERDSILLKSFREFKDQNDVQVHETTEIKFPNPNVGEYREIYPELILTQEQAMVRSTQYNILQRAEVKKKSLIKRAIRCLDIWSYMNDIISTDYGKDVCLYFKMSRWLTFYALWISLTVVLFLLIPVIIIPKSSAASRDYNEYISILLNTNENWLRDTVFFYGYYNQTLSTNSTMTYSISRAYFWVNVLTRLIYLFVIMRKFIFAVSVHFTERYLSAVLGSTVGVTYILGMWDFRSTSRRRTRFCKENIKQLVKKMYSSKKISRNATETVNIGINVISLMLIVAAFERITWFITFDEKFFQESKSKSISILTYIRTPITVSMIVVSLTWLFDLVKCIEDYEREYLKIFTSTGRIVLLNCGISVILIYHWSTMISCTNNAIVMANRTVCDLLRDRIAIDKHSLLHTCWETWLGQRILVFILVNIVITFLFHLIIDIIKSIIKCSQTSFIKPKFFNTAFIGNLCYMDCLIWIGYYYSPMLSLMWLLTVVILYFYNTYMLSISCFPRSSSSQTVSLQKASSICMFMISSLLGISSLVSHSLLFKPSRYCGPFRHLEYNYSPEDFTAMSHLFVNNFVKKALDIGDQLLLSDGLWYSAIIVLLSVTFKSSYKVKALKKIYRLALTDRKMIINDKKQAYETCQMYTDRLKLNHAYFQPTSNKDDDQKFSEIYNNFKT